MLQRRSLAISILASIAATTLGGAMASGQDQLSFNGLKGKIVAIGGDQIQWTDVSRAEMYIQLVKDTKIRVTGDVEPSFLTPGLFVRFECTLTRRGKINDDINEMTVFLPGNGYGLGIFEDGNVDPKATQAKVLIAGQIESHKAGQLSIEIGNQYFKIKLAPNAKLKIDVADYSIAGPGDEITITGQGDAKNAIIAKEIDIKLATALSGVEKKNKRSTSTKKARGKTKQPSSDEVDAPVEELP